MKTWHVAGTILILGLAGCKCGVEIVNYAAPDLSVDLETFRSKGCQFDESGLGVCAAVEALAGLGCTGFRQPSALLGGLDPSYPMLLCLVELTGTGEIDWTEPEPDSYLYSGGCMLPTYVRYVVDVQGRPELIQSRQQMMEIYAPIESEKEALSYALAVTGYSAYFGLEVDPALKYLVDRLEDTSVQEMEQGYRVRLYYFQLCGCGPHETFAIDLKVTSAGEVEELERVPVFKDPSMDGLCVD